MKFTALRWFLVVLTLGFIVSFGALAYKGRLHNLQSVTPSAPVASPLENKITQDISQVLDKVVGKNMYQVAVSVQYQTTYEESESVEVSPKIVTLNQEIMEYPHIATKPDSDETQVQNQSYYLPGFISKKDFKDKSKQETPGFPVVTVPVDVTVKDPEVTVSGNVRNLSNPSLYYNQKTTKKVEQPKVQNIVVNVLLDAAKVKLLKLDIPKLQTMLTAVAHLNPERKDQIWITSNYAFSDSIIKWADLTLEWKKLLSQWNLTGDVLGLALAFTMILSFIIAALVVWQSHRHHKTTLALDRKALKAQFDSSQKTKETAELKNLRSKLLEAAQKKPKAIARMLMEFASMVENSALGGLTGAQKAALFLAFLELTTPDLAEHILGEMTPELAKKILEQMETLSLIDESTVNAVLKEFNELLINQSQVLSGPALSSELSKAIFGKTASEEPTEDTSVFKFLDRVSDETLLAYLAKETDQMAALLLGYSGADRMSTLLATFPLDRAISITKKVVRTHIPSYELLEKLSTHLEKKLTQSQQPQHETAKIYQLSRVFELMSDELREKVIESLNKDDKAIAEQIKAMMVTFEDILSLTDHELKLLLFECSPENVAAVLANAEPPVQKRLYALLSNHMSASVEDIVKLQGNSLKEKAEEAKKQMVNKARFLSENNKINLRKLEL